MTFTYIPRGVCSRKITVTIEDNIVKDVVFEGGCSGNTQGVSRLCVGRNVDDVINTIEGIRCGSKLTSCPDQLSKALKAAKEQL